jgi:hypothetical protein
MNGKFDLDDIALADGHAYFSDMDLSKAYLEVVGDSEEVRALIYILIYTFPVTRMMAEINLQLPQSCIDAECHQVQEQ